MTRPWLPAPRITPPLDPEFRPAALAVRAFEAEAERTGGPGIGLALEQPDGQVFTHGARLVPDGHAWSEHNAPHVERLVKFLLWSRGGSRLHVQGPEPLIEALREHFVRTPTGRFDAELIGSRIFGREFEVVAARELPPQRVRSRPLGRHLDGCRIGFDLGGSDRKVAAVIDGRVVFSEETVWDPYHQPDPAYHKAGILDSLRKAAAHLPRVDAIGGSAAGVYVDSRPRAGSLFRGVPPERFETEVVPMFQQIAAELGGVPIEVVNDGEVTALAGAMALGENALLGLALGTSTAAGYVDARGNITSWLNELAFVPVDYRDGAPADEWSGDAGCAVQYLSQQAVGRLLAPAGIDLPAGLTLPERLVEAQRLMAAGDPRAARLYRTLGVYLGYAVAHFARFYDLRHVLLLGRVTSGPGGEVQLDAAREVLRVEFPELAARVAFHVPDEQTRRHGQAVAAASLPAPRRR